MGLAAGIPVDATDQRRNDRLESSAQAPRLPSEPIAKREQSERITLIRFGCTKFRVSMFPITERVLNLSELKKSP